MVHLARKQVYLLVLCSTKHNIWDAPRASNLFSPTSFPGLMHNNEALCDILLFSKYYNYSVSNQGIEESHGDNYALDYFTDVIKTEAVKFIENKAGSPMFMYIAPPSPHRPATPAPQYANKFLGRLAPRSPSYNDNGRDKHWLISEGKWSSCAPLCINIC